MKNKSFYLFSYLLTLAASCSKSSQTTLPDTYLITVKEYKTKIPIPNVYINLYHCSNYDWVFGCRSISLFATRVTNNKGEYTMSGSDLSKANEGIIFSSSQYWDVKGGTGEVFMESEAWVSIALKANKIYPDTSILVLNVSGELSQSTHQTFKPPKDSAINFRLYGNEMNKISWVIYTRDSKCFWYCNVDTLAFGNLTLSPQKNEILKSSITY